MIRNLLKVLFFPLLGRIKSKPKAPPLPPVQSDEVFIFAGRFGTEAEATDYALGLSRTATLSQDLNAAIGPDDVEIIFGSDRLSAAMPMFQFRNRQGDPTGANTYIMLSDRGHAADGITGKTVTYIGKAAIR